MNPSLAFISGLVSSITPCVIVLFPIILYRFFKKEEKQIRNFILFIAGFIITYVILGLIINKLFQSPIQNGIKIALGLTLIILGVLSLLNKINPLNLPIIKNPLLLGVIFSAAISINPCTLPYLGLIISTTSTTQILINMIFFALGLITPAIGFALIGQTFINITKKTSHLTKKIKRLMDVLLISTGVYLIYTIKNFTQTDLFITTLMMSILFFILVKSFFIINSKKELLKLKNILLLISLATILYLTIVNCNNIISQEDNQNILNNNSLNTEVHTCTANTECEICTKCIQQISLATTIGFIGIFLAYKSK